MFEEQKEGYFEKLGEFRKQEEFEDKKTLSEREKSLSWTTVWGCGQERKTGA